MRTFLSQHCCTKRLCLLYKGALFGAYGEVLTKCLDKGHRRQRRNDKE